MRDVSGFEVVNLFDPATWQRADIKARLSRERAHAARLRRDTPRQPPPPRPGADMTEATDEDGHILPEQLDDYLDHLDWVQENERPIEVVELTVVRHEDTEPKRLSPRPPDELLEHYREEALHGDVLEQMRVDWVREEAKRRRGAAQRDLIPEDADRSFEEWDADEWPPDNPMIEGLLGENHNLIITGVRGSGKSSLGYEIAVVGVDGEPLFGQLHTALPENANVGIINLEMSRRDVRKTLRRLKPGNKGRIFVWTATSIDLQDPALMMWCRRHRIGVLIIDSLRRAAKVGEGDPNPHLERFYQGVDELKHATDLAHVIFIAHPPKQAPEQVLGGMTSEAWTDELWSWTEESNGTRTLKLKKNRNLENPRERLTLRWNSETGHNSVVGEAGEVAGGVQVLPEHWALAAVIENPGVRGTDAMRKRIRTLRNNLRLPALKTAEGRAWITTEGTPRAYEPTDLGKDEYARVRHALG